jgi:hypothetical protein
LKDSHVTAIMLAAPCRVSGDHPSLTLFATILLQWVFPPLHAGWDTALFAGKYPCSLSPLKRGFHVEWQEVSGTGSSDSKIVSNINLSVSKKSI